MNEFIEECRSEWRRLGVPDHIANEMAADLRADIEEAESEGGSAEDVLGNSLFDPRQFAASWAQSRGVTARPAPDPSGASPAVPPAAPAPLPGRLLTRRNVVTGALAALAVILFAGGLLLAVGGRSASVALSVRRILRPGSLHLFRPRALPQFIVPGPPFAAGHPQGFAFLAVVLLLAGAVALGLAVLSWTRWNRPHPR